METGELHGMVNWTSMPRDAGFWKRARLSLMLIRINGLRCKKCGFLELYARQ
jgi:hypothetical protein